MENWLRERLSLCLDFDIPDEMINFILGMKSSEEVDEYFQTLLNYELLGHRVFIIKFPSQYPAACLLGCVSVQDCLPQEENRKIHPNGESSSPFVFICTDPQELPIRFPIKRSHKIYKIDPKIHTAAVKSLQRLAKLKAEENI